MQIETLLILAIILLGFSLGCFFMLVIKHFFGKNLSPWLFPKWQFSFGCVLLSGAIVLITLILIFTPFYNYFSQLSLSDFLYFGIVFSVSFLLSLFFRYTVPVFIIIYCLYNVFSFVYLRQEFSCCSKSYECTVTKENVILAQGIHPIEIPFSSSEDMLVFTALSRKIPVRSLLIIPSSWVASEITVDLIKEKKQEGLELKQKSMIDMLLYGKVSEIFAITPVPTFLPASYTISYSFQSDILEVNKLF